MSGIVTIYCQDSCFFVVVVVVVKVDPNISGNISFL